MNFKSLLFLLLSLSILACKEQENKRKIKNQDSTNIDNQTEALAPPIPIRECYRYTKNNDTIILKLEQNKGITGSLLYLWSEKDRNSGTIVGTLKGDTIFADYTFTSEGKESVREVVFLKKGHQLIEGFAPVTKRNGKTVFKNDAFDFNNKLVLTRTDCKN